MRYLSVCSGIEAATVAWKPLGWRCVGVSEIEKFPCAVLADHYPDVPNYGDFTAIDPATVGPVDALVGGTPCQAFSVAGARRSLDDARGNLTLSFVRLAHELADNNGLRLVVWENVPGVLSTKDNAFGCFLGGLVGSNEPIVCDKRWPNFGMVAGPKGKAAWCVRDAQYFGLAQRRRRVFVVASFRDGIDPAAILFERKGLQGDIAPSRQARENLAPTISARTKGGGGLGTDAELDGALLPCWWDGGQVSQTLDAVLSKGQCMPEKNRFPAVLVPQAVALRGRDVGPAVVYAIQERAVCENPLAGPDGMGVKTDQAYTLEARTVPQAASYGSAVRRLTPRECERLQGFPDDYTLIVTSKKTIRPEKLDMDYIKYLQRGGVRSFEECCRAAADGPRYKALGNSMAVPVMAWIGRRIQNHIAANDNFQEAKIAA